MMARWSRNRLWWGRPEVEVDPSVYHTRSVRSCRRWVGVCWTASSSECHRNTPKHGLQSIPYGVVSSDRILACRKRKDAATGRGALWFEANPVCRWWRGLVLGLNVEEFRRRPEWMRTPWNHDGQLTFDRWGMIRTNGAPHGLHRSSVSDVRVVWCDRPYQMLPTIAPLRFRNDSLTDDLAYTKPKLIHLELRVVLTLPANEKETQ
jgi:hypothetical protein